MSNTKGNQYALWAISNNYEVQALDSNGTLISKSDQNFAMAISVSEDGTVWILSTSPDPDGGGSRIYWSDGDGTWNEINTSDPGGIRIAGGSGSDCYFLDYNGHLYSMTTQGQSTLISNDPGIIEFDYGAGYLWSIRMENGKAPALYFTNSITPGSLSWTEFQGSKQPLGISVDYQGNCNGLDMGTVNYYSNDGHSTGPFASGANGQTLQVSAKNWTYILTYDATQDGNLIMVWVDTQGGVFQSINQRASVIASTYYLKSN